MMVSLFPYDSSMAINAGTSLKMEIAFYRLEWGSDDWTVTTAVAPATSVTA